MTVELLTECHLEFLSLKGGCTDSSEFTHVKMPHCLKSHVTAQMKTYIATHSGLDSDYTMLKYPYIISWPEMGLITKKVILLHVNNKGADQPVLSD